jgi:glucan 1,4-alpha-glucosidase
MKALVIMVLFFLTSPDILSQEFSLTSPGSKISLSFNIEDGVPVYSVKYGEKDVIKNSAMGFLLKDAEALNKNFVVESSEKSSVDTVWTQVWGEQKHVRNNYNELKINLRENSETSRKLNIIFRVFDDGVGFRYEFPEQEHLRYFTITDELTEFTLTGDHKAFWLPGDFDSQEYTYTTSKLSEIDAAIGSEFTEIGVKTLLSPNLVQTPLMMKTADGLYINIHEAALLDYPVMHLLLDKKNFRFRSLITPDAVENKAYLQAPCVSPWRTILISDKAEEILSSRTILNLNEPSRIEDATWIIPRKYVGIWWEMHIGTASWSYSDLRNVKLREMNWTKVKPHGMHGATTERTKRYIDFAAEHGFDGVLVEGWNVGWEDWFGNWKEEVFDFVTPYPDFDVKEVNRYAASKGIKMIMHHETSSSVTNYERRLDEAFKFMKENGYDAVKTGYVGKIIPRGEHHDSQWMVNHFTRVVEKAADMKIMVNSHESIRPTGLQRTFPNWISSEAARGNEFNAWSSGNPPEHETILPFTRLMGGPMDYTPGIFQIKLDVYGRDKNVQVHTTLAKQLALYVTMYSPLQMAADLPENYEKFPDAFQFIKDVPADWEDTKILAAEPGDYVIIARKGRENDSWFVGAITDEEERTFSIKLDFLEKGEFYTAEIYSDGDDAHWEKNPMSYKIVKNKVNSSSTLKIKLAAGGGTAIALKKGV